MVPLGTLAALAAVVVVSTPTASAFVTAPVQPRLCGAPNPTSLSCSSNSVPGRAGLRRGRSSPPTSLRASATESAAAAASAYALDGKELRGPLTPVEDTVLIKVDKPKEMTEGGLYMPQVKVDKHTRGTVVAAGEGKYHWDTGVQIPITVQVGDRVVFGNFDGTSVEYQVSARDWCSGWLLDIGYHTHGRKACAVLAACTRVFQRTTQRQQHGQHRGRCSAVRNRG